MNPVLRRLVGALALLAAVASCGSSNGELVAQEGDLGHIHDLVVDDDATLLVASHTGLWRIEALDRAVLVGTEQHDLMSMAGLSDGALVASGHPNLLMERYQVEGRPPFLGLVRSIDGGETWEIVDLLGDADFHALVPVDGDLYAAETSGRIWRLDAEGTWEQLGEVEARDLAVDPADPSRQLAPDYDGTVWVSDDGAATWSVLDDAPPLVEIEWPSPDTIIGLTEDGEIHISSSPESTWEPAGSASAEVETFLVDRDGAWWVTSHGGAIARSDDQGATWADVYIPPGRS